MLSSSNRRKGQATAIALALRRASTGAMGGTIAPIKKNVDLASIRLPLMQQRFRSVQSRRLQKREQPSRLHSTKPLLQSPLSTSTIQRQSYPLICRATAEELPNQQTQGIRRSASRSFFNRSHTLSASRRKAAPLFSKTLHQQWNKPVSCVHYSLCILQ